MKRWDFTDFYQKMSYQVKNLLSACEYGHPKQFNCGARQIYYEEAGVCFHVYPIPLSDEQGGLYDAGRRFVQERAGTDYGLILTVDLNQKKSYNPPGAPQPTLDAIQVPYYGLS